MFLENKYTKTYYALINKAQNRILNGYGEKHHIIPKSMGGGDYKSNLVKLTPREHFICHLLLTKMTVGSNKKKMSLAVFKMLGKGTRQQAYTKINSKIYETLRLQVVQFVSEQKKGCRQPPRTLEARKKYSSSKTGNKNPNFKGYYITPWGEFESSRLAAKESSLSDVAVLNFCTINNNKVISNLSVLRSKGYLTEKHIGKTPKELGFAFKEKRNESK